MKNCSSYYSDTCCSVYSNEFMNSSGCTYYPTRQQRRRARKNHGQQGRSMVEMLGVLAIVGVLSIGGIAGYRYAMNKYYANEILNGVSKRAVIAMAQLAQGKEVNQISLSEFEDEEVNGAQFSDSAVESPYAGEFGIAVTGVKETVCQNLIDMADDRIIITESTDLQNPITEDECSDSNSLAFLFGTGESVEDNNCSEGLEWNGSDCVSICSEGYYWDGSDCVSECSEGYAWNGSDCDPLQDCSYGWAWNGSDCVSICSEGYYWDGSDCVSECSEGYAWNGSDCDPLQDCSYGWAWNGSECKEICSAGWVWNGFECVPDCSDGYAWNGSDCVSICSEGYYWDGSDCVQPPECSIGYAWDGSDCVDPCVAYSGWFIWNGSECVPDCSEGYAWNGSECVENPCSEGFYLYGSDCVREPECSEGYFWDRSAQKCRQDCSEGWIWNGFMCEENPCSEGYYWDGSDCVYDNGPCSEGWIWNGSECDPLQDCSEGWIWNGSECEEICSEGYWDGSGACKDCRPEYGLPYGDLGDAYCTESGNYYTCGGDSGVDGWKWEQTGYCESGVKIDVDCSPNSPVFGLPIGNAGDTYCTESGDFYECNYFIADEWYYWERTGSCSS